MNVETRHRLGSGHCGWASLVGEDGRRAIVYVSYGTVVGIEAFNKVFFTERRHSVTTSKQRTTKLYPAAGYDNIVTINNAAFCALCQHAGLLARITVYHNAQGFDVVSPVEF